MNANYIVIESNISDEDAVKKIYSEGIKKYGHVDIGVNNAATDDETECDTIETITQNMIDDTFSANVRGSILITRAFVNHRNDYGRIINISTIHHIFLLVRLPMWQSKQRLKLLPEVLLFKLQITELL